MKIQYIIVLCLACAVTCFNLGTISKRQEEALSCWQCSGEGCNAVNTELHTMMQCNPGEHCYTEVETRHIRSQETGNFTDETTTERGCTASVRWHVSELLGNGAVDHVPTNCYESGCNDQ